jgi:hypothetical protein
VLEAVVTLAKAVKFQLEELRLGTNIVGLRKLSSPEPNFATTSC